MTLRKLSAVVPSGSASPRFRRTSCVPAAGNRSRTQWTARGTRRPMRTTRTGVRSLHRPPGSTSHPRCSTASKRRAFRAGRSSSTWAPARSSPSRRRHWPSMRCTARRISFQPTRGRCSPGTTTTRPPAASSRSAPRRSGCSSHCPTRSVPAATRSRPRRTC